MQTNISFEQEKEKYKLACNSYNPATPGVAAQKFIDLMLIFIELVIKGEYRALSCLGICCWFSQVPSYKQYALHYLKAGIMFNNDPSAWLGLAAIHMGQHLRDSSRAACELYFAWKYTNDADVEIRNNINKRLPKIGSSLKSLSEITIDLNQLDYLWSVLPPVWMLFYKYYFAGKIQTQLNDLIGHALFNTKVCLDTCQFSNDSFWQKASVWLALSQYFKWSSRPLYLFYIKNFLNEKEEIPMLLNKAMNCCGHAVHLQQWETFNEAIPEEAVVGVLSDMELLFREREKYRAYEHVQKHRGQKLWIPWQLPVPTESSLFSVYWESLPDDWRGSWIHLRGSLFERPLPILLGADGLLPYLLPQVREPHFSPLVRYWQERVIDGKKFKEIYPNDPEAHWKTLSILWEKDNLENRREIEEGEKIDCLSKLRNSSLSLYEYLTLDDKNNFFYSTEVHVIDTVHRLAKAVSILPQNDSHYTLLSGLGMQVVESFKLSAIKEAELIEEFSYLAYSENVRINDEVVTALMKLLMHGDFLQSNKIIEVLRGLTIIIMSVSFTKLRSTDLVRLLDQLIVKIKNTHFQDDDEDLLYYYLRLLSVLLMVMEEIGVKNVSREKLSVDYFICLRALRVRVSPRLQPLIDYAIEGLARIPNDESMFGSVARRFYYFVLLVCDLRSMVLGIVLHKGVNFKLIKKTYEDFLQMTQHIVIFLSKSYAPLGVFHKMLHERKLNMDPRCLAPCRNHLKNIFSTVDMKKDDAFAVGVLQVIDDFIRFHPSPEVQVAAVKLMQAVFEWADLWSRYDGHRLAQYFLAYFEAYAQANGVRYATVVAAAKESTLFLEQQKHDPPPLSSASIGDIGDRVCQFFADAYEAVWNRSVLKTTCSEYLVPTLQESPSFASSQTLFNKAKAARGVTHTIALPASRYTPL